MQEQAESHACVSAKRQTVLRAESQGENPVKPNLALSPCVLGELPSIASGLRLSRAPGLSHARAAHRLLGRPVRQRLRCHLSASTSRPVCCGRRRSSSSSPPTMEHEPPSYVGRVELEHQGEANRLAAHPKSSPAGVVSPELRQTASTSISSLTLPVLSGLEYYARRLGGTMACTVLTIAGHAGLIIRH